MIFVRDLGRMAALIAIVCLSACSLLPRAQTVTDPRSVYVWPVESCPSLANPEPGQKAFLTSILTPLFGNLVSGLVGIPASALSAAADADKAGFTSTGTNARYYYAVEDDGKKNAVPVPPGCYIVAFAKPVEQPTPWCSNPAFKAGAVATCEHGAKQLEALSGKEQLFKPAPTPKQYLSVPEFYAEIRFDQAGYGNVVRPALAALYYPDSLLQHGSTKPRTISLTITSTTPQKDDPLKAASIAMNLVGIVPAPVQSKKNLELVQTGWTSVPGYTPKEGEPELTVGTRFMPVTMTASIHEVGQPSVFLAAFAKAFAASSGDYTKAITGELLPASREAAEQQSETSQADYNGKYGAAQKSLSEYLGACGKVPQPAPNPITDDYRATLANAENLWYALVSNRIKANVAAEVVKKSRPFANPEGEKKCF